MKEALTAEIDCSSIEQATQRAAFTGRTRNRELAYLLGIGLKAFREGASLPPAVDVARAKTNLYTAEQDVLEARNIARVADFPISRVVNHLIRLALTEVAARDVQAVQEMLARTAKLAAGSSDQADRASEQTAGYAFPRETSATLSQAAA